MVPARARMSGPFTDAGVSTTTGRRGRRAPRFPLLAAYHLDGHSRRDRVQAFTEADIGRNAGLGAILAYHFFPEVAYWLGHANKYGA